MRFSILLLAVSALISADSIPTVPPVAPEAPESPENGEENEPESPKKKIFDTWDYWGTAKPKIDYWIKDVPSLKQNSEPVIADKGWIPQDESLEIVEPEENEAEPLIMDKGLIPEPVEFVVPEEKDEPVIADADVPKPLPLLNEVEIKNEGGIIYAVPKPITLEDILKIHPQVQPTKTVAPIVPVIAINHPKAQPKKRAAPLVTKESDRHYQRIIVRCYPDPPPARTESKPHKISVKADKPQVDMAVVVPKKQ